MSDNKIIYDASTGESMPNSLRLEDIDNKTVNFEFQNMENGFNVSYKFKVKLTPKKKSEIEKFFKLTKDEDSTIPTYINQDVDVIHIETDWSTYESQYIGDEVHIFFINDIGGQEYSQLKDYIHSIDTDHQQAISEAILLIKEAKDVITSAEQILRSQS